MSKKELDDALRLLAINDTEAEKLCRAFDEYEASSSELLKAAMLVDNDPIKIEMISHLYPDFEVIMSRQVGLELFVKKNYDRAFVSSEMNEISKLSFELSKKIRQRLEPLRDN